MVVPFVVTGPPSVQYLGESMAELLHMALDGVGGMRIEYAASTLRRLSALEQPGDAQAAAGVALELGAGRVIAGRVVAVGNELRLRADVFDAVRKRLLFSVEGRAEMSNVASAVDSLAARILARRLISSRERARLIAGEFAIKSPAALIAYLVARRHALRGERRVAADSLKTALRLDPDFGLAHLHLLRLENAQDGITGVAGGSQAILSGALARKERFSERVRRQLEIHDAFAQGERIRAMGLSEALADRFPDDPDVAFQRADLFFHFGLNLGEPHERAVAAFRRAMSFDDQDPELLNHFPGILAAYGDTVSSREVAQRCRALGLCPPALGQVDSLYLPPRSHHLLATWPEDPARGLAATDSLAAIQTRPNRGRELRAQAYLLRSNVALARRQDALSWALLDSARALGSDFPGYRLVNHIVTGIPSSEGMPELLPFLGGGMVSLQVLAWWSAARGPADSAEAVFRRLENRPWPDSAMGAAVARGLRGFLALRQGDTNRARVLLVRARSNQMRRSVPNRFVLPSTFLALTLAEIDAARGDWSAARLHLADVYPLYEHVPFIGDAQELRAKVALALGDSTAAKAHLRNFIAVWEKADPVVQPRVEAARIMLARFEAR